MNMDALIRTLSESPLWAIAQEMLPRQIRDGGPVMALLVMLSVFGLSIILWKTLHLATLGVGRGRRAEQAARLWCAYRDDDAVLRARGGAGSVTRVTGRALEVLTNPRHTDASAREETERHARAELAKARSGLRGLEMVATVAPLLGLFGTVLGMIDAFQALQDSGARADPAALAGGIWTALLTTAAGMAVAIPAAIALTWFESRIDRARRRMQDIVARLFARPHAQRDMIEPASIAAE